MKILLLTQYFWPEIGAVQVIHSEWPRRLKSKGHEITILTCFPNYPDGKIPARYQGKIFQEEEWNGMRLFRTYVYAAPNAGFAKRLLNHLSFAFSCWMAYRRLGHFDVVITEFPPLFTAFSGVLMSRFRGVPHVLNVGDLWVEAAIDMGALKNKWLQKCALAASKYLQFKSRLLIVTAKGVTDRLKGYGIPEQNIVYIPNSVDVSLFTPSPGLRDCCRKKYGWGDQVVALYHGTHGLAQGLSQVVKAAKILEHERRLRFVFMGDGADKANVQSLARQLNLRNVEFLPPQPREEMPGLVNGCDIGLVPLRRSHTFTMTLPSKMFEFMANEKPVVLGVEGDAKEIIEDAAAGIAYPPEDANALAEALRTLIHSPGLRRQMGVSGRKCTESRFSRERFASDWESALLAITSGGKNG